MSNFAFPYTQSRPVVGGLGPTLASQNPLRTRPNGATLRAMSRLVIRCDRRGASSDELEAWLGPALEDLSPEQVDRLHREAQNIAARYPDDDDADDREAALIAATQYLLGDLTLEEAGKRRRETRAAERHARVQAIQLAVMAEADGMPTAAAARAAGIDRQVLIRLR